MKHLLKKVYAILALALPLGVLFPQDASWGNRLLRLLMAGFLILAAALIIDNHSLRSEQQLRGIALPDAKSCTAKEILDFARAYGDRLSPHEEKRLRTLIDTQQKQLEHAQELITPSSD